MPKAKTKLTGAAKKEKETNVWAKTLFKTNVDPPWPLEVVNQLVHSLVGPFLCRECLYMSRV